MTQHRSHTMRGQALIRAILRESGGATIVEFAIVVPVLLLLIIGLFDITYNLYMISALQGVVQKAARDSTLQSTDPAAADAVLDAKVTAQVQALYPSATVTPSRRFYRTYAEASAKKAETWTDTDHDGTCDHGEPFLDANNNGVWDPDGANAGQGGAKDRTVYTVTVTYPRMFPIANAMGWSKTVTLAATTVLANQPYDEQGTYTAPKTLNCP